MKISSVSKKVLASALSAAMVVAFAPTVAFATNGENGVVAESQVPGVTYVATVTAANGDIWYYTTLEEAMSDAEAGSTVTLLQDIYLADAAPADEAAGDSVKGLYTTAGKCADSAVAEAGVTYYEKTATKNNGTNSGLSGDYYVTSADLVVAGKDATSDGTEYTLLAVKTGLTVKGTGAGKVTAATAAKYDNMKAGARGNIHYTTNGSVNGNGHKIIIENVAAENLGSVAVPNITNSSAILTVNTTTGVSTVKDLSVEDNTDGDAKTAGKQSTANGDVALSTSSAGQPATTTAGTSVAGLTATGLTASNVTASTSGSGALAVSATAKGLTAGAGVTVTGGTYETMSGNAVIKGGTFSGKTAQLAGAPAGTPKGASDKLAKPTWDSPVVKVESWADESKRTYYVDEYTPAVNGATIEGGTINGYVVESTIKGGTFAKSPVDMVNASNNVADNYNFANGTATKGVNVNSVTVDDVAYFAKLQQDVPADAWNENTGIQTAFKSTALTDSKNAIAAAATKAVLGLATTDKLYKDMYVSGQTAGVTVAAEAVTYVSANRGATEAVLAKNAITEKAVAAATAEGYKGVNDVAVDAKTGEITVDANKGVFKFDATVATSITAEKDQVKLTEFGPVAYQVDFANTNTRVALLYSADGTSWSAQELTGVKKDADTNTFKFAVSKAGYYALAVSDAANDAKVKAEEEAKKAAEEAAAKLIATQDASAVKDIKAVNKTYKTKSGKLAATKTFKLKAVTSESGAKATYKKANTAGKSKITVSKAGKVTLKKGLKKGKYSLKVKGTVGASSKTVTCKIVIK